MSVSDDRWTCPSCQRTVVVTGSQADVRACITAAQKRHADGHRAARQVFTATGLPPDPLDQPRRRPGRNQTRPR